MRLRRGGKEGGAGTKGNGVVPQAACRRLSEAAVELPCRL